ncbi:MAG: acyltransferase [Planctomycetales bacterium]|nr:acyltransferase [Planctomycetales bacterium]
MNIQALRGIAAFMVLLYHALPHFTAMGLSLPIYESIVSFGYIGVDIFFIISGFVMAKTTFEKPKSLNSCTLHLYKRFSRIFLGFWSVFILAYLYYHNFNPEYLTKKEVIQSFFLVNANMFDLVITPAWSLTYELYFYLLVALLLLPIRIRPMVLFGVLCLAVVIKNIIVNIGEYKYADFFLSSLLFEFIGGYFLFVFIDRISNVKSIIYMIIIGLAALAIGVYLNIAYGYIRVLTFGTFAFSLVYVFIAMEKNKIYIFKGIVKKIGDSSYTLYLTHTVLLGAFYTIGLRDYFVEKNIPLFGFIFIIIFIVSFSYVFYKFVEYPLYQFSKKAIK